MPHLTRVFAQYILTGGSYISGVARIKKPGKGVLARC